MGKLAWFMSRTLNLTSPPREGEPAGTSPLVASVCSIWSSAWLCLGDWWGCSLSSSGTAAGCLSCEMWWLTTRSMVLAIIQSDRSYCRLSWERWLHPFNLLGPVLLECCRLQPISLSSMIVLQPPVLCEGWVGHPLCLSGDSPVLMDLQWPCDCTAQYSILSIGSVSFVPLLEFFFFWTILDSNSFSLFHSGQVFHELVCPLTVVLPLMHLLMLLFTSLYVSDPSGSNPFFLSSLLLWHRFCSDPGFFLLTMFAK